MDEKTIRRVVRYVGVGGALLVPALVAGQDIQLLQNLNLGDGAVLRGQDIRAMREALVAAVARINDLESRLDSTQGAGISKANLQPPIVNAVLAPAGTRRTATARCELPGDIAIDCNCSGDTGEGTSGSPLMDQRIIQTINPAGGLSQCDCVGENVGTNDNQRLIAVVTCLRP